MIEKLVPIDKDTLEITTTEIIDLKSIRDEIVDLELEIKKLEKEPDMIDMPNNEKERTFEYQEKLNILKDKYSQWL